MSVGSDRVKAWRRNTKKRMITAMGGKCAICGYDKCDSALEFHHIDPLQKDFGFGGVRAEPKAWVKIVEELRKCVLLCSNCHREIHDNLLELPRVIPEFDEDYLDYRKMERSTAQTACAVCGVDKPDFKITCSRSCAAKHRGKIDWSLIDIVALVDESSFRQVGFKLGVSPGSVYKRYHKVKSMKVLMLD